MKVKIPKMILKITKFQSLLNKLIEIFSLITTFLYIKPQKDLKFYKYIIYEFQKYSHPSFILYTFLLNYIGIKLKVYKIYSI